MSFPSEPNCVENELPYCPRQTVKFTANRALTVTDCLYGTVIITEPVILSLIQDASFQRLLGIHQHGITPIIKVTKVNPSVSRFEHSIGAMLLVRHLAPNDLAQQVAALLHDISHTVLSHVADYVFGYVIHEVEKEQYVKTTAIPEILARFGFDWKHIASEEHGTWTLLEQPSPLLCADRLDYGLRDMVAFGVVPSQNAKAIVDQLVVHEGRIMCTDVSLAAELARGYLSCDVLAWANPHHSALYRLAGDAIRLALVHKVIKKEELWIGTDAAFWDKILKCGIPEIEEKTKYVNEYTKYEMVSSATDGNLVLQLSLKLRTIDPEILISEDEKIAVRRLTEIDSEFAKERQDYINNMSKPIYLVVS